MELLDAILSFGAIQKRKKAVLDERNVFHLFFIMHVHLYI